MGKGMTEITVSDKAYTRLVEFKSVFEAVMEETLDFDAYVESIMTMGIDAVMRALIESLDQNALLKSFQQLGAEFPAQVYPHVVKTLKQHAIVRSRAAIRHRLGATLSSDQDIEDQ
jgi:hypothetical protein